MIRDEEACFESSLIAIKFAQKYGSRLHILHISTEKELQLFGNMMPLKEKRITAEVCVHHLWFSDEDYEKKGTLIKWNPAVKSVSDRAGILKGVLDDRIDVIATDHAPHTMEEKQQSYFKAPSGGPLVQHSLVAGMEFVKNEKISIEKLVEKMCHNPSILFQIDSRGFIREGYFADLVVVDLDDSWEVMPENIYYKCGWSPLIGQQLKSKVKATFVNGHLVYQNDEFFKAGQGKRLLFDRNL